MRFLIVLLMLGALEAQKPTAIKPAPTPRTSRPPPYTVYPFFTRRCCAQAHQCYVCPLPKVTCRIYTRPRCTRRFHRRCFQPLKLLRMVWARFRKGGRRCCTVLNCPKIYYTRCTFCVDRCPFYQRICTPHYYRRYRLRVYCPGFGIRYIWRYFPHCCVCRYCPLRYFPIINVNLPQ